MSTRVIVALQSDKHAGHRVGLCNPDTILPADDEVGRPTPMRAQITPFQRALWKLYTRDIDAILEFADGDEVIVFDLGDQTHGHKYPDNQMTSRAADQLVIALANWEPWLGHQNVRRFRFSKGTGAHTFGEGSSEIIVAEQLKLRCPDCDIRTLYHGVAELAQGIRLDYAHHGPGPGIRDWTHGNEEIIASMLDATMPPLRAPGDFTLSEYAAQLRARGYQVASRGPIRRRLEAQVEAGMLQKLRVWDNEAGRALTVYRVVKSDSD